MRLTRKEFKECLRKLEQFADMLPERHTPPKSTGPIKRLVWARDSALMARQQKVWIKRLFKKYGTLSEVSRVTGLAKNTIKEIRDGVRIGYAPTHTILATCAERA